MSTRIRYITETELSELENKFSVESLNELSRLLGRFPLNRKTDRKIILYVADKYQLKIGIAFRIVYGINKVFSILCAWHVPANFFDIIWTDIKEKDDDLGAHSMVLIHNSQKMLNEEILNPGKIKYFWSKIFLKKRKIKNL